MLFVVCWRCSVMFPYFHPWKRSHRLQKVIRKAFKCNMSVPVSLRLPFWRCNYNAIRWLEPHITTPHFHSHRMRSAGLKIEYQPQGYLNWGRTGWGGKERFPNCAASLQVTSHPNVSVTSSGRRLQLKVSVVTHMGMAQPECYLDWWH